MEFEPGDRVIDQDGDLATVISFHESKLFVNWDYGGRSAHYIDLRRFDLVEKTMLKAPMFTLEELTDVAI